MASFQPTAEHYNQVVDLLRQASNPQPAVQAQVWASFDEYSKRVDFNCYLAHILADRAVDASLRQWAAVVLSNGIKQNYLHGVKANVAWIQGKVMECLGETNVSIRNAVANCVSHLALKEGSLPSLLEGLCGVMEGGDAHAASGACKAVHNICEDHVPALGEGNAAGAAQLLPFLLKHTGSPDALTRELSLSAALNLMRGIHELHLPDDMPKAVADQIPGFLRAAMQLAMDGERMQTLVCSTLVFVGDTHFAHLRPHLKDTLAYLVGVQRQCTGVKDNIALEACDFWPIILEQMVDAPDDHEMRAMFEGHLPVLIPLLVAGMKYSEIQLSMIHKDSDDIAAPDRVEDILPRWRMRGKRAQKPQAQAQAQHVDPAAEDEDDGSSDEENDDDWDGDDMLWSLRRCCASTLDSLALTYGATAALDTAGFLNILIPEISNRMAPQQADWREREAAIMALGAITEGVPAALAPHAAKLIQGLLTPADPAAPPPIKDPNFLIRAITCWTLQRFYTAFEDPQLRAGIFACLVDQLGGERSKKAVGAAASAVRTILARGEDLGAESVEKLLVALHRAYAACQTINLNLLLNVTAAIAEDHGEHLGRPEAVQHVMGPLITRWQGLPDDDVRLQAIMTCMAAVAPALGPEYQPFVKESFDRSVRILHARSEARRHAQFQETGDEDYIICCLDLLGGVLDAVESSVEPLIAATPVLLDLLFANLADPNVNVRQSSLALVGDIAKFAWPHLASRVDALAPLLLAALDPASPSVCINAAYAFGEVAVRVGPPLRGLPPGNNAFPHQVTEKLIRLICAKPSGQNAQLLGENASVALGRLALACPDVVAPHMDAFIKPWCTHARRLSSPKEQEQAFLGLSRIIRLNPSGCYAAFAYVCHAACSLEGAMTEDLAKEYTTILGGFKAHIGAEWPHYYQQFPPKLQEKLGRLFGLA